MSLDSTEQRKSLVRCLSGRAAVPVVDCGDYSLGGKQTSWAAKQQQNPALQCVCTRVVKVGLAGYGKNDASWRREGWFVASRDKRWLECKDVSLSDGAREVGEAESSCDHR